MHWLFMVLLGSALMAGDLPFPGEREQGEEENIRQRRQWFTESRGLGQVQRPDRQRAAAVRRAAMRTFKNASPYGQWVPTGPSPMLMGYWFMGPVSGRVSAMALDPGDPDTLYLGAASGGLWKTVDRGLSWTPIFETMGTQTIGAIALDPSQPTTLWVGTGEQGQGCSAYFGIGIFRSLDGGARFEARNGSGSQSLELSYVSSIAVHPQNSDLVLAAGHGWCFHGNYLLGGLFLTEDGGQHWRRKFNAAVNDVMFIPDQPNSALAAVGRFGEAESGIYRSSDSGSTWTRLTNGIPSGGQVFRSRIAIAPSDPRIIYALMNTDNGTYLYRSGDQGQTWSLRHDDACEGQCSYNLCLAVHPNDPDTILVGSIRFSLSTNGGTTLEPMTSRWGADQAVHQDTHVLMFDPTDPNRFYVGSDGGVWTTDDIGSSFVNLNTNINSIQFYDVAVDPTNPLKLYGGAQDNSSSATTDDGQWALTVVTGDGFTNAVDPSEPEVVIQTSYPWEGLPNLVRSRDAGRHFQWIPYEGLQEGEPWPWVTPLTYSGKIAGQRSALFIASNRVYRSFDHGDRWTAISDTISTDPGVAVSALIAKPVDSKIIVMAGTQAGNIQCTAPAASDAEAPVWTDVTGDMPEGWISDLDFTSGSTSYMLATRGSMTGPKLLRAPLGQATWQAVGTGLPDIPANSVLIDPEHAMRVFVGTDIGVYVSEDGADTFTPCMDGMPLGMVVNDLEFSHEHRVLTAGTYGRGAWQLWLPRTYTEPLPALFEATSDGVTARASSAFDLIMLSGDTLDRTIQLEWGDTQNPETAAVNVGPSEPARFHVEGQAAGSRLALRGNPLPQTLVVMRDAQQQHMAAFRPHMDAGSSRLFIPHIARDRAQFFTALTVVASTNTDLFFESHDGQQTPVAHLTADTPHTFEWSHVFGDAIPEEDSGFLTASDSTTALRANLCFGTWDDPLDSSVLPLGAAPQEELIFPHVTEDLNLFWTGLVLANSHDSQVQAELAFHDRDGKLLASETTTIPAGRRQVLLFDGAPDTPESVPALPFSLPAGTAWLKVTGNQTLHGFELFGSNHPDMGSYMEGLPATGDAHARSVLPYLHLGDNQWTGLVLLNSGEAYTAARVRPLRADGAWNAEYNVGLGVNKKFVATLASMFTSEELSDVVSVEVQTENDRPITVVCLFGDEATPRKSLAGYHALPL